MSFADDVERIGPEICRAGLDSTAWPGLLDSLLQMLGGHCGSFICRRPDGSDARTVEIGFDAQALRQFFGYFADKNVLLQRGIGLPAGSIVTDRDLMPKEELRRSEYYNDLLLKQENTNAILAAVLWRDEERFVVFNCNRSPDRPEFEEADKKRLRPLLGLLGRAIDTAIRLGAFETQAAQGVALLDGTAHGILVLSERGTVAYANQSGERLLAERDGLFAAPEGLEAATPAFTTALRAAIGRAASGSDGGAVVLARPRRGRPLYALAMPLPAETGWLQPARGRVLLLLRDPAERAPLSVRHLQSLFGLTPMEARLAVRLYEGDELAAAVERLGISRHTGRAHLNAILRKTETGRQAELMRRLAMLADLAAAPSGRGPAG